MFEATICEIIKDSKILLKRANRGVSKCKWNGLGGKLERGETAFENVLREIKEESSLTVKNLKKHGVITFYQGSKLNIFAIVHIFSASEFTGEAKDSEEGEVKWFDLSAIPYNEMWIDDTYWLPLVLEGKNFNAEFVFDEKLEKILEHKIWMY